MFSSGKTPEVTFKLVPQPFQRRPEKMEYLILWKGRKVSRKWQPENCKIVQSKKKHQLINVLSKL